MSNNIYDILKAMRGVSDSKPILNEGKKSSKPDFLDMDKDGDTTEPMKKAVKDKSKGAIAEAVARVEQQLAEKYMGFKKTAAAVAKGGSADDPEAVAASIGRKKYGKEKFQKAAAAGKKLGEGSEDHGDEDEIKAKRRKEREPDPDWDRIKKEDVLTPKEKKFAKLAPPPDKITYADKIAGAKKTDEAVYVKPEARARIEKEKAEKARAPVVPIPSGPGVDLTKRPANEGWDDMLKAQKERSGPQPSGGSGIKSGKRYGGAAQKDEPETDNETGEVAKKGRGRPKKDKFAK